MAATGHWKVYDAAGNYRAACYEPEAAAVLMGFYGYGAKVKWGHRRTVWTEGVERQPAAESYDFASLTMQRRASEPRGKC